MARIHSEMQNGCDLTKMLGLLLKLDVDGTIKYTNFITAFRARCVYEVSEIVVK